MTLQFDTAISALAGGAQARGADPLLETRLADAQGFLLTELIEVEAVLSEAVTEAVEPGASAARHLVALGGKRVRPLSLLLAARCFGGHGAAFTEMAAVVELVHSATLLHDDVVDEGMERRGAVTSRRLWGNGVSVLSGDLLLVSALDRTRKAAPSLLGDLIDTLRRLVNGEIVQLRGRTELDVSEATYYRVLEDKTASLFSFATRAGALLASARAAEIDALGRYGEALGIAFQLIDDVIDYAGENTGKTLFADLAEGKITLPLVLAVERDAGLVELVQRIHQGDEGPVPEVSRRVIESGACDVVRARALDYTARARAALEELAPSGARQLLDVVAQEMAGRLA